MSKTTKVKAILHEGVYTLYLSLGEVQGQVKVIHGGWLGGGKD